MKGSIKKNKKTGKWDFVIDIGKDSLTGNRKQKKRRGFKTRKEAERALNTLLHELNEGTFIEPSKQTYGKYLDTWMSSKRHDLSLQTYKLYTSYISSHINPILGKLKLSDLNTYHIQHFVNELRGKGLSDSTVKRIFNVVNTSLNNAKKLEMIKKNPANNLEKPKVNTKDIAIWDHDEISLFLKTAKKSPYYIVFLLSITTGMRQGELLGLRFKDVDFENKCLYIRQTLNHDGSGFKEGAKSKAGYRSVGVDSTTLSALEIQRVNNNTNKLKHAGEYEDYDLVACTKKGRSINPRNLIRTFYNLTSKANLPKIRFHDLRHTHASLMLQQGENVKIISERLGHSSVKVTLDIYSHVLPNMQNEASDRFAQKLFNT
ncbi:integrase [Pontibacillus chungwhensis BH030062]|uniref:Integrase n=1 Tax=Pontibacillus chungwhensis BH030062 TaxID=1385513 RepID=A0A0A2UT27_9BACI|nr:site-specific integrase [Pontibacillus chungwhensis]KGP89661.1 integrase [Pontibacillus chungwhensis BH030062]